MTHEDAGHYAKKHPEGTHISQELHDLLKPYTLEGQITCAESHKIARDLKRSPAQVGVGLDLLELRIACCQLGLFGYPEKKLTGTPPEGDVTSILDLIRESLIQGKLSCEASWSIAEKCEITRLQVAAVCEENGIKIKPCQLGAF